MRRPYDSQIQNNLGLSLALADDYVQAETAYRRALQLDKETGAHESLAPTLHNLAELLLDKGESKQAEALYRQALAINEQAFGPDDPSVALTLADLGDIAARTR